MPPKVNIIKNIGDIKQTVDYPQSLGSDFFATLDSIFLLGVVRAFLGPFGFIIDAIFFQSDGSTVDFSAEVNGTGITYDSNGDPITGTIESVTMSFEGEEAAEITGLSTDVATFVSAPTSFSVAGFVDIFTPGTKVNFQGGNGDDTHTGTTRGEKINLGAGDDVADGRNGKDVIVGGAGRDILNGGNGDDKLLGGNGIDQINGGRGADQINGGNGADVLRGNGGDDIIKGGKGKDDLNGGVGDDQLFGGGGADLLFGAAGANILTGGAGADTFQFSNDGEQTVVTDFTIGEDRLSIKNIPFISEFQDVLDRSQNLSGDVIIDLSSGEFIRLEGVQVNQLSETDFIF